MPNQSAAIVLDGKVLAQQLETKLASYISILTKTEVLPKLTCVLVGDDPASQVYTHKKVEKAKQLGILGEVVHLPATTTQQTLHTLLTDLNNDNKVTAILLQLPLPKHLNTSQAIACIDPRKDVDGLHPNNLGLLYSGIQKIVPCTPLGIFVLLKHNKIVLKEKLAIVLGRSILVGKPIASLLLHEHCTVAIFHSYSNKHRALLQQAEIIISAIGSPHSLHPQEIKKGTVVIDVGINRIETPHGSKIIGDIHPDVFRKAGSYTPVPGGVGPMTIAMLMHNTILLAMRKASCIDDSTWLLFDQLERNVST